MLMVGLLVIFVIELMVVDIAASAKPLFVGDLMLLNNGNSKGAYSVEFEEDKLRIGVGFPDFEERVQFQQLYGSTQQVLGGSAWVSQKNNFKIMQKSECTFSIDKAIQKCELIIQNYGKGKIKQITLEDNKVPTDSPKGKYLYIFYVKWGNGHGIYEQEIEII
jgi:hypothetical protein